MFEAYVSYWQFMKRRIAISQLYNAELDLVLSAIPCPQSTSTSPRHKPPLNRTCSQNTSLKIPTITMKFSIVAVALFSALLSKASPIPDIQEGANAVDGSTGVVITTVPNQDVAFNDARPQGADLVSNFEVAKQSGSRLLVVSPTAIMAHEKLMY